MFKRLSALFNAKTDVAKPESKQPHHAVATGSISAQVDTLKKGAESFFMQGRLSEAERCIRDALGLDEADARGFNNLAVILRQQGRLNEARQAATRAVTLNTDLLEAHFNIADMAKDAGEYALAILHYERCLSITPGYEEATLGLVHALTLSGKIQQARKAIDDALQRTPKSPMLLCYLGNLYKNAGDNEHAREVYTRCLEIDSSCWPAAVNLGEIHFEQREWLPAKTLLMQALNQLGDIDGKILLGHLLLLLGDLENGFALTELRFGSQAPKYQYLTRMLARFGSSPAWNGEALAGRTLLVWAEQGLGDTIMMLRFLPELRRRGAGRLIVQCQSHLLRMVQAQAQADAVICDVENQISQPFDFYCSTLSLPHLLRITLDNIPAEVPYLQVPESHRQFWAERTSTLVGLKVGLTWAGNPDMLKDAQRSIALSELAPLMSLRDVSFVSLQKGGASAQIQATGFPITDWMDDCSDMLDTAALITNLDLVIAVDTSVAHLTGALGIPVWLLSRIESEWRWLLDRSDSPWYPSMRIFRQTAENDWSATVLEVCDALAQRLTA